MTVLLPKILEHFKSVKRKFCFVYFKSVKRKFCYVYFKSVKRKFCYVHFKSVNRKFCYVYFMRAESSNAVMTNYCRSTCLGGGGGGGGTGRRRRCSIFFADDFCTVARLEDDGDESFISWVVSDIFRLTRRNTRENDFITHKPFPDCVTNSRRQPLVSLESRGLGSRDCAGVVCSDKTVCK